MREYIEISYLGTILIPIICYNIVLFTIGIVEFFNKKQQYKYTWLCISLMSLCVVFILTDLILTK